MVGSSDDTDSLLVLGRPTNLDNSRTSAGCACSTCWMGLF